MSKPSSKIDTKPLTDYQYRKLRKGDKYLRKKLPWHQLPDETLHEYQMFVIYCELGVDRSVRKAYNVYKHSQGEEPCISIPNSWWLSYRRFQWPERAAQWDDYQTKQTFLQRDIAHKNNIKKFREVLLEDAENFHKAGKKLLKITNQRIKRIEQVERSLPAINEDLTARDLKAVANCYDLSTLANTVSKSVDIMAEANNQTGRALCVDKLLQKWSVGIGGSFEQEQNQQLESQVEQMLNEDLDGNDTNENILEFTSNNNVVINSHSSTTKLSILKASQPSLFDLVENDLGFDLDDDVIDIESIELSENQTEVESEIELGESLDLINSEY